LMVVQDPEYQEHLS